MCSANVYLNLSGGVGGEILRRFGPAMQRELHEHLHRLGKPHVAPGSVVTTASHGTHFKQVIRAVAIDAFYTTTADRLRETVASALTMAAAAGARSVALTALATGYGRLSIKDFGKAIVTLQNREFPPLEQVTICVRSADQADELCRVLQHER